MPRWDADDARLVSAALAGHSLCVDCIIKETGVTRARVNAVLADVEPGLRATNDEAPCVGCLATTRVFRLT